LSFPEPIAKLIQTYQPWFYLLPLFLFYVPFLLFPAVAVFYVSLHQGGSLGSMSFVGIENYVFLLSNDLLYRVIKNTFVYTGGNYILTVGGGLALALGIRASYSRIQRLLQTAFLLPFAIMPVGVGLIWMFMYSPSDGVLNVILSSLGLGIQPLWLGDASIALFSIVLVGSWQSVGFYALIWLVGLENIDQTMYEAAKIDGVGKWDTFRYITLPQLKPIWLFLSVVSILGSLRIFDFVWVMTQGGPAQATEVFVTWMYKFGFVSRSLGVAAAIGVILFFVIAVLGILSNKLGSRVGGMI
jgi:ABC-type sugar transport system permease subunit